VARNAQHKVSVALFIRLLEDIYIVAPHFLYGFINVLCDYTRQVGFRCFKERKLAPIVPIVPIVPIAIGIGIGIMMKSNSRGKFIV